MAEAAAAPAPWDITLAAVPCRAAPGASPPGVPQLSLHHGSSAPARRGAQLPAELGHLEGPAPAPVLLPQRPASVSLQPAPLVLPLTLAS